MEDFTLYLSNLESALLYRTNKGYDFGVELPRSISLQGKWSCRLESVSGLCTTGAKYNEENILPVLYVTCDFIDCSPSASGCELPVLGSFMLGKIEKAKRRQMFSAQNLVSSYVHVRPRLMRRVRLRVIAPTKSFGVLTILSDYVHCQIHFRRDG